MDSLSVSGLFLWLWRVNGVNLFGGLIWMKLDLILVIWLFVIADLMEDVQIASFDWDFDPFPPF